MAWQAILFALVGTSSAFVNIVVYNGVLAVLRAFDMLPGFDFLVAQFVGFLISVAWAFWFNRRYVFKEQKVDWFPALVKVYIAYAATGIGLSALLSLLWVYVFHIPKEILTILNDILCFPINFLLNKYGTFRKK